jgi:hypothetical protein
VRVVDPTLVLLGFCLCSGTTSTGILCFGQNVAMGFLSQTLIAAVKEGGG